MSCCGETVVVGFDGTDTSRVAIAWAARRAGAKGRVVVVHCFEGRLAARTRRGADGGPPVELDAGLSELCAGTACDTLLSAGAPARALVETARDCDATEIVVGARSLGLVRSGLGSVAGRVLIEADRPVTVVPPGYDAEFEARHP